MLIFTYCCASELIQFHPRFFLSRKEVIYGKGNPN
jgi:hypothetical protein